MLFLLIFQLSRSEKFQYFRNYSWDFENIDLIPFFLAVLLIFFNWGIEAYKWKFVLRKIQKISLLQSTKGVLAGVSASVIMPNRIADYLGRIFYLQNLNRAKAIVATVVSNYSQLLVTLLTGLIGIPWFLGNVFPAYTIIPVILIFIFLIYLYFNLELIVQFIPDKFKRLKQIIRVVEYYQSSSLKTLLGLSGIRYLVFALQYFLLFKAFGVEISNINLLMAIPVIFLIQSFVPSVVLIDLGIRGIVVLFIFSNELTTEDPLLLASYSLWFINLIIPALAGVIFLAFKRIS